MNPQEQQIIKNIVAVLPVMDESKKNYLLGFCEGMVLMMQKQQKEAG